MTPQTTCVGGLKYSIFQSCFGCEVGFGASGRGLLVVWALGTSVFGGGP